MQTDDYSKAIEYVRRRAPQPIAERRERIWQTCTALQLALKSARIVYCSPAAMQLLLVDRPDIFDAAGNITSVDAVRKALGDVRALLGESMMANWLQYRLGVLYDLFETKIVLAMKALDKTRPMTLTFCYLFDEELRQKHTDLNARLLVAKRTLEAHISAKALSAASLEQKKVDFKAEAGKALKAVDDMIAIMVAFDVPLPPEASESSESSSGTGSQQSEEGAAQQGDASF